VTDGLRDREPAPSGVARMLSLIMAGEARSRTELAQKLGLSRGTVSQWLEALFESGLVRESNETLRSGGRPARALSFNAGFGITLAADIGETHTRVAITDLEPRVLVEEVGPLDVASGPEPVLRWVCDRFRTLLGEVDRPAGDLVGIGLSLPAPVDYGAGRVVGPSIMTGWDGFEIRERIGREFDAPLVADNDVNVLTIAEHRGYWPSVDQMLFVKAGTGIGSGIIAGGSIYRGAQGAAGDIGHIRLGGHDEPLCRCGSIGCVEALAAGWAIARDLRTRGFKATDGRDVLGLVLRNEPMAVQLLRQAGRILGEVISDTVSILNPSVVVVGGTLSRAEHQLLAGIRELVYQRSLPLATRDLIISPSQLPETGGILGAARLVIETRLHPDVLDGLIAQRS